MNRIRRVRHLALVGAVAAFALAACGDDDNAATETTVQPAATAVPATAHAGHSMVTVDAVDYGFERLPAKVEVGTMLGLTNASTTEVHELVAVRLPDDETRPVDELVALPQPELMALIDEAPPAMVLVAPPGQSSMPVVGDGTLTEPGRYLVMCSIPIGADPEEFLAAAQTSTDGPPDVDGGPPHFTAGMFTELIVEPA